MKYKSQKYIDSILEQEIQQLTRTKTSIKNRDRALRMDKKSDIEEKRSNALAKVERQKDAIQARSLLIKDKLRREKESSAASLRAAHEKEKIQNQAKLAKERLRKEV